MAEDVSHKKIFAAASLGGHWKQLLRITQSLEGRYEVVYASTHPKCAEMIGAGHFYQMPDFSRQDAWRIIPSFFLSPVAHSTKGTSRCSAYHRGRTGTGLPPGSLDTALQDHMGGQHCERRPPISQRTHCHPLRITRLYPMARFGTARRHLCWYSMGNTRNEINTLEDYKNDIRRHRNTTTL